METVYKDLFDSSHLLSEQVRGHLFNLVGPEGPALVLIAPDRRFKASHPGKVGFLLGADNRLVEEICSRLDDGEDPLVIRVKGGCAAACQLSTERISCGYLLVYLEGYTPETVGANLSMIELILSQAQLVCELVEKNNQYHHLKLLDLSRKLEMTAR